MEEQKRKKAWYKKWWVWLIIVFIVGGIGSNLEVKEPSSEIDAPSSAPVTANEKPNEPEKVKEETAKEQDEDAGREIKEVGESVTTKNFKVTVEKLNKPKGNDFNKPGDGKEFVSATLLIENISDKDYSVSSIMMFDAYQDGFSVNESISAQIANEDVDSMDGSLAAGKKIRGELAYELPVEWKELEIDIDLTALSFSSDGEIKVILQNK
ncbi:DUF4352 domain-containing protein [Paenibacillus senegalimassiliensis]|uniref:DUF4352 domain-containing protein n=1 Tax=Paenibacillus senegalimassiliensis TaxID=1737426 RepID=UPI00073F9FF6|nr:DUF4352 domain-containing protein [Paenibacillus senegalimassiliensis]